MPEPVDGKSKGKRLDRGNVQVWAVKEPWIDIECKLGEGPYWEKDTNMVRFTDVFGKKVYWVDLEKGPSSLRNVDVEDWVGVTADIAGSDTQILVAAKYGYALMDKATGKLTYIARIYDNEGGKSERMRFNDGAIDPAGRFWAGSMTDNSKYAVEAEGTLFRLDSSPAATFSTSTTTSQQPSNLSPPTTTAALSATPHPILHPVSIPNGIGFPSSGQTLLFTDSPTKTISAFDYNPETGAVSNRRPWFKLEGYIRIPKSSSPAHPSTGSSGEDSEDEDFHFTSGMVPDGFQIDEHGDLWSAVWGAGMVIRIEDLGDERVVTGVVRLPAACTSCPRFVGEEGKMVVTSASEKEDYPEDEAEGRYPGRVFLVDVGVKGGGVWKFGEKDVVGR